MPAPPALTMPKASSGKLANWSWYLFKLGFGLFSLAFTWITISWKIGFFPPKDTDEEKRELAAGALYMYGREVDGALTRRSPGTILEPRSRTSSGLQARLLHHLYRHQHPLRRQRQRRCPSLSQCRLLCARLPRLVPALAAPTAGPCSATDKHPDRSRSARVWRQ